MLVIKNINNNVSLCLDSQNNEVVVFGKGVGFIKPPYEVPLDKIEKTFYNVSDDIIDRLNTIPSDVVAVASKIVDLANNKFGNRFGSNVVFTLADHIQFAIERKERGMYLALPILHEVSQNYPEECDIGARGLELIYNDLKVRLPRDEASAIALHLVNYASRKEAGADEENGALINECVKILEDGLGIKIKKNGFNYYRFVTHMYYLFKRVRTDCMIDSSNRALYDSLRTECADIAVYADQIRAKIEEKFGKKLYDEEVMYLILHINRLCSREDSEE